MPYIPLSIDTSELTFGQLAGFVDQARAAGVIEDQIVGVDATDAAGNPVDAQSLFVEIDQ